MYGISGSPTGETYAGEGAQLTYSGAVVGGGVTRSGSDFGFEAIVGPSDGVSTYGAETFTKTKKLGNIGEDTEYQRNLLKKAWGIIKDFFTSKPDDWYPYSDMNDPCPDCQK